MRRPAPQRIVLFSVGLTAVVAATAATINQPTDEAFDDTLNSGASVNVDATASSVEIDTVTATTEGFYRSSVGEYPAQFFAAELDKDTQGAWTNTDTRFSLDISAGDDDDGGFYPGILVIGSSNKRYRTGPYVDPAGSGEVATLAEGTLITPPSALASNPTRIRFLTGPSLGTGSQSYSVDFDFDGMPATVTETVTIEDDATPSSGDRNYATGNVQVTTRGVRDGEIVDEVVIDIPTGSGNLTGVTINYTDTELAGPLAVSFELSETQYDDVFPESTYTGTYQTGANDFNVGGGLPPEGRIYWYGVQWDETIETGGSDSEPLGSLSLNLECGDGGAWTDAGTFNSLDGDDPSSINALDGGACEGIRLRYTAEFEAHLADSPSLDDITLFYDIDADGDGFGVTGIRPDGSQGTADCDDSDPAVNPDADELCGDGIDNNCDGSGDSPTDDEDNDGLTSAEEDAIDTDPCKADTDSDLLSDIVERDNSLTDPIDADSDDDGLIDGQEDRNGNNVLDAGETDPNLADTDSDGLQDGTERGRILSDLVIETPLMTNENGVRIFATDINGVTYPEDADAGDTTTDPLLADSDGDGLCDGAIAVLGQCQAGEDFNGNGIVDGTGINTETDPNLGDTDGDGANDFAEHVTHGTDPRDQDSDNDGLNDQAEITGPTNPLDADSDDDAILDGSEGSTSPVQTDSDNDGLSDGLEIGRRSNQTVASGTSDARNISYAGTDGAFVGDVISSGTTQPNNPDSDGDGLCDGAIAVSGQCSAGEDLNANGAVDGSGANTETNPNISDTDGDGANDFAEHITHGTDPLDQDSDNDGLNDQVEIAGSTDPLDADSDDDAILDGSEVGTSPILTDTDGDGLNDGLEIGRISSQSVSTGTSDVRGIDFFGTANTWTADVQGSTTTSPSNPDTDGDGLCDGPNDVSGVCVSGEDLSANGRQDGIETDPNDGDSDDDDRNDRVEIQNGSDPLDDDTDNDGILDGSESIAASLDADRDDDGISDGDEGAQGGNANSADTDADGLPDGLERGVTVRVAGGTSPSGYSFSGTDGTFTPDADPGTTTLANNPDSDGDGLCDGPGNGAGCSPGEDTNANGIVDQTGANTETNPNAADSDSDSLTDGQEVLSLGSDPLSTDTDGDGLADNLEQGASVNILDADSDDDGISDGDEVNNSTTTANVTDTDGDGLSDGLELGVTTRIPAGTSSVRGISVLGTALSWQPDTNSGTTTRPNVADSDGDGLCDGPGNASGCTPGEDTNANGDVDQTGVNTETNPNAADTDGDGANDGNEVLTRNSDPLDDDTDDDGLLDGEESPTNVRDVDSDDDGLSDFEERPGNANGTTPNDADLDNDGLTDGLELSRNTPFPGGSSDIRGLSYTGTAAGWQPDTDTSTGTLVGTADTDGDGLPDGIEDLNNNGLFEPALGETNPNVADTDGDGLVDGVEDANQNGIRDLRETDPNNPDTDDDGLTDGQEDADGDRVLDPGETNPLDSDTDEDWLSDGEEVNITGTNPRSLDSDGDGALDAYEIGVASNVLAEGRTVADIPLPLRNTDNADLIDALDTDDDNDTQLTATEIDGGRVDEFDTDGDGIPNFREEDDDDDDALTRDELQNDTDPLDRDSDNDSLFDGWEYGPDPSNPIDTDRDFIIDANDADDDDDGILTIDEVVDTNGDGRLSAEELEDNDFEGCGAPDDGIPSHRDLDSDGDGICDGIADAQADCEPGISVVRPGGGTELENRILDRDEDGVPNVFDCDDDDGGVGDTDGDGLTNNEELALCVETDPTICLNPFSPDTDGDGIDDDVEVGNDLSNPIDTDNDGIPNALDDDDDNDTVLTRDEDYSSISGTVCPTEGNQLPEGDGDPTNDNTDGDEFPDYLDTDDDNDGVLTADEAHPVGEPVCTDATDEDLDGIPDYLDDSNDGPNADNDGDGITNGEEASLGLDPDSADSDNDGVPDDIEIGSVDDPVDSDGDDTIDALDQDDDDDGIPTDEEGSFDLDGDGVPNYLDDDSDGDGISDADEGTGDSDGDGAPDFLDDFEDTFGDIPVDDGDTGGSDEPDTGGCDSTTGSPLWLALIPFGLLLRRRRVGFGQAR